MIINVEISGITPLLMNRFIDESGIKKDKNLTALEEATKTAYLTPENKLYYPTENIFSCIISAGKFHKEGKCKVTTARSSLIPAGVSILEKTLLFKSPETFDVDSRPVVNPSTGGRIMKHRACLNGWCLEFTLIIDVKMFSEKTLKAIVEDAGYKCGLGDFRPERKGSFGRFSISKWERKD